MLLRHCFNLSAHLVWTILDVRTLFRLGLMDVYFSVTRHSTVVDLVMFFKWFKCSRFNAVDLPVSI